MPVQKKSGNLLKALYIYISKHNVWISGGDMTVQRGKDENNEFFLHYSSSRNWEYLAEQAGMP